MGFLQNIARWKGIIFFAAICVVMTASVARAAQNYRVNVSQTLYISEFSKNALNNCASDIFIPTNTLTEQTSFLTNKPACVSLTSTATVGNYTYSGWSGCSASCGGGTQTRTQSCNYDSCINPQPTTQSCNTQACTGAWVEIGRSCGSGRSMCSIMCRVGWLPAPSNPCSPIGSTAVSSCGSSNSVTYICQ